MLAAKHHGCIKQIPLGKLWEEMLLEVENEGAIQQMHILLYKYIWNIYTFV